MANRIRSSALVACLTLAPAIAAADPAVDQQQPEAVSLNVAGCFAVGGFYHQSLAQVVTAGRAGTLVAVAAPVVCNGGASLVVEIRGVRAEPGGALVPDATVRATGTVPAPFLPYFADPGAPDFRMLALSQPVTLAAGERFAFVLSSAGECALAQPPVGQLYPGGDASFHDDVNAPWIEWAPLLMDQYDLPFQTWMAEGPPPEPPSPPVRIDVKPGSDENPVNLGARGSIPVALLGSATFDVRTVDVASVRFAGAAPIRHRRGQPRASIEDVNADGVPDLVLHFWIQELALRPGDTQATLTARTLPPLELELAASDRVRVVPLPTHARLANPRTRAR